MLVKAWVPRTHNPLRECPLRFYWDFRPLYWGDNICMLFLPDALRCAQTQETSLPRATPSFHRGNKSTGSSPDCCQSSLPGEASRVAESISR